MIKLTQKNKLINILFGTIFTISSMLLSFYLIVNRSYSLINIIFTLLVTLGCSIYIYIKTFNENIDNIKKKKLLSFIFAVFTVVVLIKYYRSKILPNQDYFNDYFINPYRFRFFVISWISAIYLIIFIGNRIIQWLNDFYSKLDKWDKKAYKISSIVSIIVIVVLYATNSHYYLQYDSVYSMDSGFVLGQMFQNAAYYDIRHPLMSIFTFPVGAIASVFSQILVTSELTTLMTAIIIQIINSQLLILIGLMLKKLTNNKFVFILYILSFSTIINTIFLEKYNLCTFLLVLYVFILCSRNKSSTFSIISSVAVLPTNAFIGICEIIKKGKVKDKIKNILKIILISILVFIVLGRINVFTNGINEIKLMQNSFATNNLSIIEKMYCTINMISSSIIGLPSKIISGQYMWENINTHISLITILIFLSIIIGVIRNRKELFVKISSLWVLFAFVLFIVFNWSPNVAPLFSICFSWAIIPLFTKGIEYLIYKLNINKKLIYGIIITFIMLTNVLIVFDINKFLVSI